MTVISLIIRIGVLNTTLVTMLVFLYTFGKTENGFDKPSLDTLDE